MSERKKLSDAEITVLAKERPYALMMIQTQLLYDIAGMLDQIIEELINFRQEFKRTIPEGVMRPIQVEVTDKVFHLTPQVEPSMPWMSATIFNDGPDPVYVSVHPKNWAVKADAPLKANESVQIDVKDKRIDFIALWCEKGKTASVRIFYLK